MITHRQLSGFLLCLGLLAWPLTGLADNPHDRGIGVYLDQDLFTYSFNEDRDYTNGIALEFFWQHDGLYPMDRLVESLGRQLGIHPANAVAERSFMLGSINFTPDDLSAREPVLDDRPYASLIYLSNKRVYAGHDAAVGIEMQFGILGTGVAREVQQALHSLWRDVANSNKPVDPKGWGHQISNGGEPTLRLRVAYSKLLAESAGHWDLAGTTSANLGYQTNLGLGLAVRTGRIASPVWTLPYDPINRGNFLPSLAGDEWYLWAAYHGIAVGYDALLQGQFRDSDVTYGQDDIKRLVHNVGVGLTFTYKPAQVTFAINAKSSELNARKADRNQVWGGIYTMLRF